MDLFGGKHLISCFVLEFSLDPWVISEVVLEEGSEGLPLGIPMFELTSFESLTSLILRFQLVR